MGVQDIYLPMMIPMSFLEKEKDHVAGFAPELAVITHGGGKDLTERLAIRPTSETLFCDFFKDQIKSYRDLPLLRNQWANILRWEKRTRPFLRTAEFHWQEGHTLHETEEEAREFALQILNDVYIEVTRDLMAIDGIKGRKSESEKFAGGLETYTFEPMMSNGWALQICTSHLLASGFAKQFDIKFLDREGEQAYPAYTSWGMSTRTIGGIISSHSDQNGLIIPPKLSNYQAMILPIYGKDNETDINDYVLKIAKIITDNDRLLKIKGENFQAVNGEDKNVLIDRRNVRLGEKINDWELSGYPVRIECGQRDLENGNCVMVSRITGEKVILKLEEVAANLERMLEEGQQHLLEQSGKRLKDNIVPCQTVDEIGVALEKGQFALYEWDLDPAFEEEIKDKFKATTRCFPTPGQFVDDLMQASDPNKKIVVVARAF